MRKIIQCTHLGWVKFDGKNLNCYFFEKVDGVGF